jgi:HAE1 family hydrophobic/amphiphilic exporter-1
MNIGHYFIDRPRSAAVISIFIVLLGLIAYGTLPVSQYPEISPPTIVVRAIYPGATPEVVAQTVATPIEQEVNGVERMLYMTSQSTSDGVMSLNVVFELGTNLDTAQVLVQNRIAVAEPRLPEEVRRIGVTTTKSSPDLMMVVHLESPGSTYDTLYISNYALLQIRDVLARIDGIGNINVFGAREYSMRVWLDPDRLSYVSLTAGDVVRAVGAQNVQLAGGTVGEPPKASPTAFQIAGNKQGRLIAAQEFEKVIVKSDDASVVRV